MSGADFLIDALCRAAFAPQQIVMGDSMGNPTVSEMPSPLVGTLATMLQKAFAEDVHLRATVLAELTKPEMIQSLVGELAKGVGRMRVNASSSWSQAAEVPEWVREALTASLTEWLGTDDAAGLVPQMLERGTIKITVERADGNAKAAR